MKPNGPSNRLLMRRSGGTALFACMAPLDTGAGKRVKAIESILSDCEPISHMGSEIDVSMQLPTVSEFRLRPWELTYGADYYGAVQVAADYCGLRRVPLRSPGVWQHGTWPPWQCIRPELIVYDAPKSSKCFVARKDQVTFLQAAGYTKVRAIGLPILYTRPSGLARIPNSLLVMPTHSLRSDVSSPSTEQYVREVASIKHKFNFVAACVSASCITKGLWVSQFAEQGIPVMRGAGIDDCNSLKRMRALFDRFEYMTTDSYGSHVYYASYFGAKVSIWGTATPMLRENLLADGPLSRYPEAVDQLLSEETACKAEAYLGRLRLDPWSGVEETDTCRWMLGHENNLTPDEMRAAFGWTPLSNTFDLARETVRGSHLWRAGAAAKRRLLTLVRGRVR